MDAAVVDRLHTVFSQNATDPIYQKVLEDYDFMPYRMDPPRTANTRRAVCPRENLAAETGLQAGVGGMVRPGCARNQLPQGAIRP